MANTDKPMSEKDATQCDKSAFNDSLSLYTMDGFVMSHVGHKIVKVPINATTEDFEYYDAGVLIAKRRIIYTDSSKNDFLSDERIA